ncbi:MAG: hypothetical protein ICV64_05765 [Thermoleophilia bacterium]|nr:hypothetical protein [Thermoleophilia bacterium]
MRRTSGGDPGNDRSRIPVRSTMRNARLGALVLAAAVAAGCSGSDGDAGDAATNAAENAPSPSSQQRAEENGSALGSQLPPGIMVRNHGIGLTLPPGWDGRITEQSPGELPVAHAATFALPADHAKLDIGKAASRVMDPEDLRIVLTEVGNQIGTQGFDPASLPVRISRSDLRSSQSPFVLRDHAVASRRFAIHGRPFSLLVEFGRKLPTARQLEKANRVASSLEIDPRAELDPAQWPPLRRPLKLPRISTDAACPRSSSKRAGTGISSPLGAGPVYPGIGSSSGVASLKDDLVKRGWYLHKTLWAISPRYRGPVLIRGRRIDGPGVLRFNFRRSPELRLHRLPSKSRSVWRYAPSHTALRGPGCFALQVDGSSFSRAIVFEAVLRGR